MTQSTLAIGSRVRVKQIAGGAFYSHNYGKEGVVTQLGDVSVTVRFDDGSSDYGRRTAVVVVSQSLKVGDKVKIVGEQGGLFYSFNVGKEGVVTKVPTSDDGIVVVRFEDSSTDFGRIKDVALVVPTPAKDEQGFISNRENRSGTMPVPRGTIVDVLYNDGTIILDLPAGTGASKRSENKPQNVYSATTWAFNGSGSATIVGYRFAADRPATRKSITHAEMKKGMKVKLIDGGTNHTHWGFRKGGVYDCADGGPISPKPRGEVASCNWGDWVWELVEEAETPISMDEMEVGMKVKLTSKGDGRHEHWGMKVGVVYDVVQHSRYGRPGIKTPGGTLTTNYASWTFVQVASDGTLDAQLAGLRAEMEVVKSSIATANRELEAATQRVATKQAVVDKAQEELAALVERVAKHGLKFVEKSAQDAHDEGKLSVGVTLLAVTPEDTEEHKPGKQYKIIQRDRGDTSEWKLESEDGYGWWIRNTELKNYTVVA